jgi:predicted transcriptional regulator
MTKDVLLSVRISRRLNAKLERLAKLTSRTKSWLVCSILSERADTEIEYAEAIAEGIRAADRGDLVDHEVVVADMRARAKERRKRAA